MTSLLPLMVLLPLAAALPGALLHRRKKLPGWALLVGVSAAEALMGGLLFARALPGGEVSFRFSHILGFGLSFKADGFRALYALVAGFMWTVSSLFTPQYMERGHSRGRYCAYTLATLGSTLGVFLSDDLITAFLFFEIMSFTSYLWVMHEETPAAMRAAETYLSIAVLGGMAILLGLLLLQGRLGTLAFDELAARARTADPRALFLPGMLILAGFGAKAGMFPLHVWLPKAHPVAPAPASALLSGVLTKVGVFGILILAARVLPRDALFGNVLLVLALITMFLGALLALFATDLKRTLACSSMSQIGFILVGAAMQIQLGEHNALAASGTVLHMLNHSLIKLALFLCAGGVYLGVHKLDLNSVRGSGRGRPLLHLAFLAGAASLGGVPLFSGYVSKTLLHESLLEQIEHLAHLGRGTFGYQAAELLFVLTGGITAAYMLKLYIALFHDRPAAKEARAASLRPASGIALALCAAALLPLGLFPARLMSPLADASLPFLNAKPAAHAVDYFSLPNLLGAGKSLVIGVLLYVFFVRRVLMRREADGSVRYLDRWPAALDLEEAVYRPLTSGLVWMGAAAGRLLDTLPERLFALDPGFLARAAERIPDGLFAAMRAVGLFAARAASTLPDALVSLSWRSLFRRRRERQPVVVSNRFAHALGRGVDGVVQLLNRTALRARPVTARFADLFAAAWKEADMMVRRVTNSLSFSLMVFAVGLLLTMVFLLMR